MGKSRKPSLKITSKDLKTKGSRKKAAKTRAGTQKPRPAKPLVTPATTCGMTSDQITALIIQVTVAWMNDNDVTPPTKPIQASDDFSSLQADPVDIGMNVRVSLAGNGCKVTLAAPQFGQMAKIQDMSDRICKNLGI